MILFQHKSESVSTLFNRKGLICILWIMVQQIIVATSTIFIIKLIQSITEPNASISFTYLFLFAGSLIIVYIPTAISQAYLDNFRFETIKKYLNLFAVRNFGKTILAHKRVKDHYESWITNECTHVFQETTQLLYDWVSTFFNSIFSILTISILLDGYLLWWYALAGIFLFLSDRAFSKSIEKVSTEVQKTRKNLASVLLRAWENVFVGNTHNLTNWKFFLNTSINSAEKTVQRYNIIRSFISSITIIFIFIFVAFGVGIYIFQNLYNVPALSAMIVTFPRQIMIIQNVFMFFNLAMALKGVKVRLLGLDIPLNIPRPVNIDKYVNLNEIIFFKNGASKYYEEISEFTWDLANLTKGRITLRGKNGSGKSTLLSHLAQKLGEKVFFLPTANQDLIFDDKNISTVSDGERIIKILSELNNLESIDIVILDEWDANLDEENIRKADQMLENLSDQIVIVEARHRQPPG